MEGFFCFFCIKNQKTHFDCTKYIISFIYNIPINRIYVERARFNADEKITR